MQRCPKAVIAKEQKQYGIHNGKDHGALQNQRCTLLDGSRQLKLFGAFFSNAVMDTHGERLILILKQFERGFTAAIIHVGDHQIAKLVNKYKRSTFHRESDAECQNSHSKHDHGGSKVVPRFHGIDSVQRQIIPRGNERKRQKNIPDNGRKLNDHRNGQYDGGDYQTDN